MIQDMPKKILLNYKNVPNVIRGSKMEMKFTIKGVQQEKNIMGNVGGVHYNDRFK